MLDERKITAEISAYAALFSVAASLVMSIGAAILAAKTIPALIIIAMALLGANFAKIAIPPNAIRLFAKHTPGAARAARALALVWLIPMVACCVSSSFFAHTVLTLPVSEWSFPTDTSRQETALRSMEAALRDNGARMDRAIARQYRDRIQAIKSDRSEQGERWGHHTTLDSHTAPWDALGIAVALMVEALSAASLVLIGASSPPPPSSSSGSTTILTGGGSPSLPSSPYAAAFAASAASARLPAPQPAALLGAAVSDRQPARPIATPSEQAKKLERALANHGVRGRVTGITGDGPVVTRYAFRAAPGTRIGKIEKLADELAMEMHIAAISITPTPEDGVICFDLPKPKRQTVEIEAIYASAKYQDQSVVLPLALGVDIAGRPVVADLADMPHLLIAGTTGSGKSVGLNAMVMSLLNRLTPAECRFIMIDPKMLELSVYDGVPHLLTPVVTDPADAIAALNWAVREMDGRYVMMTGVARGLTEYNAKMLEPDRLPRIVILIDEFADLMLTTGKTVETAVQRLAQKARAAGIHLIMATQRPDAKVITGIIKANFPSRLSYNVASRVDAGVIGLPGAENLLGRGDLLCQIGGGRITRAHGPFVSSAYVSGVVEALKNAAGPADYIELGVTENGDDETAVFDQGGLWTGEAEVPGEDDGAEDRKIDQAIGALCRLLPIGESRPAPEIKRAMAAEGFSKWAIEEAAKALGVRREEGSGRTTIWAR